ncbi:MAG TPA: hypothetical protein VK174_09810 [Chitinophagales bacterium]|nr:hypothetical protein [Chitinophagales bacterium]
MNNTNNFFKILYSSPSMIWKGGVGLLFVGLAFAILFLPSFDLGLESGSRYAFGGLLLLYGGFRLYSCYAEYKLIRDERE